MKQFLKDYFSKEEHILMEDSLKARIDAQYYIDRDIREEVFEKMIKNAPVFLVKCKNIILKIREEDVNRIRKKIMRV
jgi:uncharacterized protein (UPF0332 family)